MLKSEPSPSHTPESAARQALMELLARAARDDLAAGLERMGGAPVADDVRQPEIGLVMLRGRIGGTGAPFNIGEATVTRAIVRLPSGLTGYSCLLGRDPARARLAAIVDALWQDEALRSKVEAHVLMPVRDKASQIDELKARQTAATKVDFFTLVRGED